MIALHYASAILIISPVRDHHVFLQHFSVQNDSDKLLYCLTGNANIGFTEREIVYVMRFFGIRTG